MKNNKLTMIGNAHLDTVWLWNWQEGFQEVKATFRSALDRMKEDDEFVFTCSSALHYFWVEQSDPEMFKEVQDRVEEGRWEIIGGWWVQPDCNIPSGESYVRQGLYGQRYFLEKFGKMATTGYNVDSFGHNGNLPQILKKSGMDSYVFMRPMPLEKALPARLFKWQSADGSAITAYRIPYEYCSWGKDLERYSKRLIPELKGNENHLMQFYGVGNHGGGPTKENIQSIHRLNMDPNYPEMRMGTVRSYFDDIHNSDKEHPIYIGDLQHHASGCYSVHSKIKKQNREAEELLQAAEIWCSIATHQNLIKYPDNFAEAWQAVLFNQFHDTLAGTSLPSAYRDAEYFYGYAMAIAQMNLNQAIQAISWRISIPNEENLRPIAVFNSHAWSGKMLVELEVRGLTNDDFYLLNSDDQLVPAQRIQSESAANGQCRLVFVAELQSLSYELFKLYVNTGEAQDHVNISVDSHSLETERWKLNVNPDTGFLDEMIDKRSGCNVFRREGAKLSVYRDNYDTWAHNIFKFDDYIADMKVTDIKVIEKGPVRSVIRVSYEYGMSRVQQDFRLYRDLEYVEVKVRIDWRTPSTLLKLRFPVDLNFRKPSYEIPYGYIEKSANGEEEPGQGWVDLSGEHPVTSEMYGVAIANNAKYSYSMNIDEIQMTLLRNAVYAHHDPLKLDPDTDYLRVDDGFQEFTYIILPHQGSWQDSDIVRYSKEINYQPDAIIESYHDDVLPSAASYLDIDQSNIVMTVLKKSEDGDGFILRLYESKGQYTKARLSGHILQEELEVDFVPNEIKTLKFEFNDEMKSTEVNLLEFEA